LTCGFARSDVIAEVGWCGCCTDLVCQNGQLVVDPLADWQPVLPFVAADSIVVAMLISSCRLLRDPKTSSQSDLSCGWDFIS